MVVLFVCVRVCLRFFQVLPEEHGRLKRGNMVFQETEENKLIRAFESGRERKNYLSSL
jgi:hypothetical protein